MRLSTLFGRTLREAPADAEHSGYQLALRAGLVRPLQAGSFALLPLGMRVLRRIEAIMHEELERIAAQELRLPVVQPATLWQQSGRYSTYGPLMLRLEDRSTRPLIVAPTHEEAIAEMARREVASYRQLPAIVYQIHTKYRDELRAKGGLMRMREFTMLDAYSLDADAAGLDASYERLAAAFERIFARCGLQVVAVEASAGEMGGSEPREYMALSESGEDTLVICPQCGYAANIEVAVAGQQTTTTDNQPATTDQPAASVAAPDMRQSSVVAGQLHAIATPNTTTITALAAFLDISAAATAKAVFFDTERGLLFAVIRGDLEVNEGKLRAAAGVTRLEPASAAQIVAAGAVPGYASPVGIQIVATENTEHTEKNETDAAIVSSVSSVPSVANQPVLVIADHSVANGVPLVAGANRSGYHLANVVYGRDWQATHIADIATARAGDPCSRCGTPLTHQRGVEVGHIFKLGTRYTTALGATMLGETGSAQPIVMGSYGIGLERMLQLLIEQHHDTAGITWPVAVAPFDVHLLTLGKGEGLASAAEALAAELEAAGLRVLYDDRSETAGVKFNDADLIGLPLRLVLSARLLASDQVELKPRVGTPVTVARTAVLATVREYRMRQ